VVAGMVLDVAKAAPLPEAKPNEILATGFGPARRFLARETAAKRVCGAVVAIAHDDKLVPRCLFALASMTKPMAAIAGLMLLEQGRSPLQAKLADYYPVFVTDLHSRPLSCPLCAQKWSVANSV